MSGKDYNKQVEKRQRIRSTTLVVGVDVGNAFNAVGFMNKEGKVLNRCAKLYNNREGFEQFVKMIEGLKIKYGLKDVLIGMEPTGHYWRKLAYFTKEQGYESSSAKSDQRDALTLTNITREGKYLNIVIEDGTMRQLRTLAKTRERLVRNSVGTKNALHAALDDYFPELHGLFWSMGSRSLWGSWSSVLSLMMWSPKRFHPYSSLSQRVLGRRRAQPKRQRLCTMQRNRASDSKEWAVRIALGYIYVWRK
jgi:hypothetical protein